MRRGRGSLEGGHGAGIADTAGPGGCAGGQFGVRRLQAGVPRGFSGGGNGGRRDGHRGGGAVRYSGSHVAGEGLRAGPLLVGRHRLGVIVARDGAEAIAAERVGLRLRRGRQDRAVEFQDGLGVGRGNRLGSSSGLLGARAIVRGLFGGRRNSGPADVSLHCAELGAKALPGRLPGEMGGDGAFGVVGVVALPHLPGEDVSAPTRFGVGLQDDVIAVGVALVVPAAFGIPATGARGGDEFRGLAWCRSFGLLVLVGVRRRVARVG